MQKVISFQLYPKFIKNEQKIEEYTHNEIEPYLKDYKIISVSMNPVIVPNGVYYIATYVLEGNVS